MAAGLSCFGKRCPAGMPGGTQLRVLCPKVWAEAQPPGQGQVCGRDFGARELRVHIPVLPVTRGSAKHLASLSLSFSICTMGTGLG